MSKHPLAGIKFSRPKPRGSVKLAVLVESPILHVVRVLFSRVANSCDLCAQSNTLYVAQVERAADRLEAQAAELRALVANTEQSL